MTDDKPADAKPQTFSGAGDPWFYLHAQNRTRTASGPVTDYVPLAEYLFRYDRGGFWVGAAAFRYFGLVPFNRATRWFLDDFLHTRMLYRALHGSGESARFIVQDLAVPYEAAEQFVDFAAEKFDIWPLWLCPLRETAPPTFHPHAVEPAAQATPAADGSGTQTALAPIPKPMLNIGLWGWGPSDPDAFVSKNRELESRLSQLGGMKWLYAHTYYTADEFWRSYDRASYERLRKKYAAGSLPSVYDKVRVDPDARREEMRRFGRTLRSKRPLSGLYGIWKSIQSKDYKLHRNATWKYKPES
jgi:hypothetical protein